MTHKLFEYITPNLGSLSLELRKFPCDPREVRGLINLMPIMFDRTFQIFDSILSQLPVSKYRTPAVIAKEARMMQSLSFPHCGLDSFYGLKKHLMPFPAYYVLFVPLR